MGSAVYSNDRRIQVVHPNRTESSRNNNRDDWLLHIHQAEPSDSGIYECQINTEPKRSKAYVLNVVGESSTLLYANFYQRIQLSSDGNRDYSKGDSLRAKKWLKVIATRA